jgi:hypothetical protein
VESCAVKGFCADYRGLCFDGDVCEALCDPIVSFTCIEPWNCALRSPDVAEFYCHLPTGADWPPAEAAAACGPPVCKTGFDCVTVAEVGASNCPDVNPDGSCCTAICDTSRPDSTEKCTEAGFPGTVCTPIWAPGVAEFPPSRLGRCVLP